MPLHYKRVSKRSQNIGIIKIVVDLMLYPSLSTLNDKIGCKKSNEKPKR